VIGAVFGQTEGLLGEDLDLRELQRTGRIGRIDVEITSEEGKSTGKIIIPSSLNSSETALIAASLETIERIGPCDSKIKILSIKDVREDKRDFVMKRAKSILKNLFVDEIPSTSALTEEIKETVRTTQLQKFEGLPCGPDVLTSDEIVIVEGRADVVNLLKNGIKNAIAIEGTVVPQPVLRLTKERITTLFVDGDRGGDLIVKELLQIGEVDYIAKAPEGKEVEELSKKEIFKSLRERVSIDQYKTEHKK
jgi:DNA primase